jgi:hypothetical protein
MIINYTAQSYKECLDISLPTWLGEVKIYSDSNEFGIKEYSPCYDFDDHCVRKILTIKKAIKENMGKNLVYLDTDVIMTGSIDEVFENPADLIVTRMIRRDNQAPEINAGVFFIRANEKTLKMCDLWLSKEKELRGIAKYPEQNALNWIATQGYDGLIDLKVSNVSEKIYNCENDNPNKHLQDIQKYKPKLIHLKTQRWKDKDFINKMHLLIKSY